jgi:hypothetical protein
MPLWRRRVAAPDAIVRLARSVLSPSVVTWERLRCRTANRSAGACADDKVPPSRCRAWWLAPVLGPVGGDDANVVLAFGSSVVDLGVGDALCDARPDVERASARLLLQVLLSGDLFAFFEVSNHGGCDGRRSVLGVLASVPQPDRAPERARRRSSSRWSQEATRSAVRTYSESSTTPRVPGA